MKSQSIIHVLRGSDPPNENFFSNEIVGSQVIPFGLVEFGSPCLKMALATTEGGATFPAQYHDGGIEVAVILAGSGEIEVLDEQQMYAFSKGDVVLIPAHIIYQVRNTQKDEKLIAWLFFCEDSQSYWPDGRLA